MTRHLNKLEINLDLLPEIIEVSIASLKELYPELEKNKETIVRKGVEGIISSDESKIPVYVLATDEELMIARDTYNITVEE